MFTGPWAVLGTRKKRTYWKPGIFVCSQEVIILMIYFVELRQLFKAWTSFALSEKRERMEEKEVLTPNFYGIEKKGVDKKVCKRNFFSCQEKLKTEIHFFYWKNSGFRQIIKVNHFYSYHRIVRAKSVLSIFLLITCQNLYNFMFTCPKIRCQSKNWITFHR